MRMVRSKNVCDHGGKRANRLRFFPSRLSCAKSGGALATRRHFLGKNGQDPWLGESGYSARRCIDARREQSCKPIRPRPTSGSLRARLCAKGQTRNLPFYVRCAAPRWIYGITNRGFAGLYDKDLPESVRGNQALTGMTASQARFPIAAFSLGVSRKQGKSGNVGKRSAPLDWPSCRRTHSRTLSAKPTQSTTNRQFC